MIHFKDNKTKSALSTRWAQMSKQEQIIERKKMEIQAKLESQKQAAALAAQAKLTNPTTTDDKGSANIFSNDGSFMSQFKALLQKQNQDKQVQEDLEKVSEGPQNTNDNEEQQYHSEEQFGREQHGHRNDNRRKSGDKGSKEKHRRWGDRGRNRGHSPTTPVVQDRKKHDHNNDPHNIPSLMQIPIMPPKNQSSESELNPHWSPNSDEEQESNVEQENMGPDAMGPGCMPPNFMGQSLMGPGPGMGPGQNIGPGMGPGPGMGSGPMGPRPNMGMGPGPNMGPNMGSMMGSRGPMPPMSRGPMPPGGPMPPFMGGPPNFSMPPNFMGPNGPGGPCGPMPPNMCGPNGPNGPMPPFFGPPFPNPMMGPNGHPGPPNSMMPPNMNNNMPFMGSRPPFGPNGPPNFNNGNGPPNFDNGNGPPNFGNGNGPPNFGNGNGPPNFSNSNCPPNFANSNGPPNFGNSNGPPMPFMPPNSMSSNAAPPPPNSESDDTSDSTKFQNIPPPMPMSMNHMPNQKNMDLSNIPAPMKNSQVLSADALPPSVQRAASEVACNGDHWEHVLKAIQTDQNLWFLNNTNSNEYKAFRQLVSKIRSEQGDNKPVIKPEDKYEPEFSLEDDDSYDDQYHKQGVREDSFGGYKNFGSFPRFEGVKREQASSQSDEESESKQERRKKKKSRWSDEPPLPDIKPPGIVAPLPPGLPVLGPQLAKIDEEGLKLTTVNRNNHALMQYAMTNYGTTNLSAEDWKKCEDNFKLNLLYQDMLKKRQEVERLAAAGRYKYEYDSDEDTAEGTWEHKLRSKEMNATERWADELTKQAAGKHHIGDFLPPEELKKFMEKYSAVKSGKEPDLSDYKEFKLKEDNVGFKMLQKLGWNEGQGLGAEGSGIVDPINKANQPVANLGLGASTSDSVDPNDDEFDAYRKRMMLAYRFRPNPLNNPRRPYY